MDIYSAVDFEVFISRLGGRALNGLPRFEKRFCALVGALRRLLEIAAACAAEAGGDTETLCHGP